MRGSRLLPLLAAAAGLLAGGAGCAPQFDRIETGVVRNQAQLEAVQRELALLRQEVSGVETVLRLDQDAGKQADMRGTARLSQLTQKIDQLIQQLDDNAAFMRTLSARVDLLATRAGLPPAAGAAGAAAAGAAPALPEEGRAIFRDAQLNRSRGNGELARAGFKEFLAKHGESELADDATYWLGELDYADGLFADAQARFEALLARWPASELGAAARLKLAYCLFESDQPEAARQTLRELIARYPDAAEAGLARERLAAEP